MRIFWHNVRIIKNDVALRIFSCHTFTKSKLVHVDVDDLATYYHKMPGRRFLFSHHPHVLIYNFCIFVFVWNCNAINYYIHITFIYIIKRCVFSLFVCRDVVFFFNFFQYLGARLNLTGRKKKRISKCQLYWFFSFNFCFVLNKLNQIKTMVDLCVEYSTKYSATIPPKNKNIYKMQFMEANLHSSNE